MSKKKTKEIPSEVYKIYGIFDFHEKKLIYVDLDLEAVELQYDIQDYDDERYNVVEFSVLLT